jgi:RNA polymerase sigma factor (sigma-70 family)
MMLQVATWVRSNTAPWEPSSAFLGSSFLATVPFRAVGSQSGRVRSASGGSAEAKPRPSVTGARFTAGLPQRVAGSPQATTISIVVTRGVMTVTETVFPTTGAPPRAESSPHDDIDLELLKAVQLYLSRLGRPMAPDATEHTCWERFYRQYDPLIRRVVRSWRLSDADTDDCIQEVWSELITKLAEVDYNPRRGRFGSWLFTFVRRKVIRFIRRKTRHSCRSLADCAAMVVGHDDDPLTACQRQEDRQLVRRMLAVLRTRVSDTNYRVLHLRWIDGRSNAEIAALVNLTQDQVRYHLKRMKRKFKALIAPRFAGDDASRPA